MMRNVIAVMMAIALTGCAGRERLVKVSVPVPVARQAPADLTAPLKESPPTFVSPAEEKAAACLTSPEGIADFKRWTRERNARLRGWEAWAIEPKEQP